MVPFYNLELSECDEWCLDLNTSIELFELVHHYNKTDRGIYNPSAYTHCPIGYTEIISVLIKTILYILCTLEVQ